MRCALFAVTVLLAPSHASAAEPAPTRASGGLAVQARSILRKYCADCHTGSADPGRSKLNLMKHADLTAKVKPVPLVAPAGRSQLLELVKDGSMPPANRAGPDSDEIAVLEAWVRARAPAYPVAFDERFTLDAIADDLQSAKAGGGNPEQTFRYASFAHRVRDGEPLPDLGAAERQLNRALALATGTQVRLDPVDPTATLYRIDLAKLGWADKAPAAFKRWDRARRGDPVALRPFDLLLMEYPDAGRGPVPFVRGEWLTDALLHADRPTPLADDVRSVAELERALPGGALPEGPPVPRRMGLLGGPKPADRRAPLFGWYAGDVAPDPAPFALTAELVADHQPVKSVRVNQLFKLKVRSDRRVNLALLFIQADGTVTEEPLDGSVLQASTPSNDRSRELSWNPAGFKVATLNGGGDSVTEHLVLFASEERLPPLTHLRSLHDDRPVWRFLPEPAPDFDPKKVVRKVIPVVVAKK